MLVHVSVQSDTCKYIDTGVLFTGRVAICLRFGGAGVDAALGGLDFLAFFVAGREGMSGSNGRSLRPIPGARRSDE